MKVYSLFLKFCNLLLLFLVSVAPLASFGASTTFAPSSCPVQTDLLTHITSEIDTRVEGLTANDTTKRIFTSQNHGGQIYVRNPSVWTNVGTPIDLTGLSPWNTTGANTRAGTLISPRHIAFATHYPISNGATVRFVANDGTVVNRTMTAQTLVDVDITLGVLDTDVPETITHYPIISKADFDTYLSSNATPMLVLDQEEKALIRDRYVDDYQNFNTHSVGHVIPPATTTRSFFNETLIGGDSGNPAFVIINGKPVLMLTHTTAGSGPSYSHYRNGVNTAMATLGGGYEASSYNLDCFNAHPVITNSSLAFTVNENATTSVVVGAIEVTDEDVEGLTFSITSGNVDGIFDINSSGEIVIAQENILDFNESSLYSLGILVRDSADVPLTVSTTTTIAVDNELDIPVILTSTMSVPENEDDRYSLGSLAYFSEAEDTWFEFVSGDSEFDIDEDGEVFLTEGNSLDYEDQNEYEIEVMIENAAGSSTSSIVISVTDQNDSPAVVPTTLSVIDGSSNDTVVGTISVEDQDTNNEHVFSIIGGNTSSAFSIDPYTGVISVNNSGAIDRDLLTSIALLVRTQDTGTPALSDAETITVSIAAQPSSGGGGGGGGGGSSKKKKTTTPVTTTTTTTPVVTTVTSIGETITVPVASVFTRDLTIGATGEDVRSLQKLLNSLGFTITTTGPGSPGSETTLFGPATKAALIRYQTSKGVPATGYFGPLTRATLSSSASTVPSSSPVVPASTPTTPAVSGASSASFTRDLTIGATGEDVRSLQKLLNSLGFTITTTGPGSPGSETTLFGPATKAALIRYQTSKGVPATGYFGSMTRGSIQ